MLKEKHENEKKSINKELKSYEEKSIKADTIMLAATQQMQTALNRITQLEKLLEDEQTKNKQ
jgi:hypothetical protein